MSAKEVSKKINVTKNYRLFGRSQENRPLNPKKHRKLEQSMREYGFLTSFPVSCYRDKNKHLIVKDGQHRLAIAETLGLPVYWVEEAIDFDVAKINCTSRIWGLRDYAQKFATNGLKAYQEGLEFSETHGLPLGTSFALLGGYSSFTGAQGAFIDGKFKVRDRAWAEAVAAIYGPLVKLAPVLANQRLIEACMAVCRVDGFDGKRLLQSAARCREKLMAYSTRDGYLDMLEAIYNFHRAKLVGLKAEATMVMRERNPAKAAKAKSHAIAMPA